LACYQVLYTLSHARTEKNTQGLIVLQSSHTSYKIYSCPISLKLEEIHPIYLLKEYKLHI